MSDWHPGLLEIVSTSCAICGEPFPDPEFARQYVTMICAACDARAVNVEGLTPEWNSAFDAGQNPVFVDGYQCWRRYRFGGYVTMRDLWDCESLDRFYDVSLAYWDNQ